LPTKFGGLWIFNPTEQCTGEFNNSRLLTEAMATEVKQQESVTVYPKVDQADK